MNTEVRRPATVMFLRLLLYVLAFIVPTTVLAVLMPDHMLLILATGMGAMLAVTAFITGWQWDSLLAIHVEMKFVLYVFLATGAWVCVSDVLEASGEPIVRRLVAPIAVVAVLAALMLAPFYLGRALHRRKTAGT